MHESSSDLLLERRISPERLAPYRSACDGDLAAALRLYAWNTQIAGAFWETIGHVEVLVRNVLHDQLVVWSTTSYSEARWYLDPGHHLNERALEEIANARLRATRLGRSETAGRVVAELSFGFWRYLMAGHYDRTLWRNAIYKAFPGAARRDVFQDVSDLHELRNRLAHHEPVHARPLSTRYDAALRVAGWACPDTRAWIKANSRVPVVLAARPMSR